MISQNKKNKTKITTESKNKDIKSRNIKNTLFTAALSLLFSINCARYNIESHLNQYSITKANATFTKNSHYEAIKVKDIELVMDYSTNQIAVFRDNKRIYLQNPQILYSSYKRKFLYEIPKAEEKFGKSILESIEEN